jgi:DNA-3-methyladenine glycosylase I
MSKDLKKRGWSFVGPTTVYAFMQAMGLVNDHLVGCLARPVAESRRRELVRPRSRAGEEVARGGVRYALASRGSAE